jgi:hypothetical protein
MLVTYKSFRQGVLLVLGLVLLVLSIMMAYTVEAAPLATVPRCSFSPTEGGSGTIVHVQLDQWFSKSPVDVGFAVPITPGESLGAIFPDSRNLKPIEYPLASMQPIDGQAETTFRIPANLSSGKPVPVRNLYLVCMENNQISMGGGAGPALFKFTISNLPVTGHTLWTLNVPLAMLGTILIVAGLYIGRRLPGSS